MVDGDERKHLRQTKVTIAAGIAVVLGIAATIWGLKALFAKEDEE